MRYGVSSTTITCAGWLRSRLMRGPPAVPSSSSCVTAWPSERFARAWALALRTGDGAAELRLGDAVGGVGGLLASGAARWLGVGLGYHTERQGGQRAGRGRGGPDAVHPVEDRVWSGSCWGDVAGRGADAGVRRGARGLGRGRGGGGRA